jgi:anti-anti-sigma factor
MGGTVIDKTAPLVVAAAGILGVPNQPVELTRGSEQALLARLEPMVRRESVELDLTSVERIDAAGLAALITLYSDACKTGHEFTVTGAARHVHEVLSIVGLDRILIPGEHEAPAAMRGRMEQNAA